MLSIVIVNWNTREFLRACLTSIAQNPPKHPHETIVVDNASGDDSTEMVRSEFPEVNLVASKLNLGYAMGNNVGFEQAKYDVILTLNPDTEVFAGTLDETLRVLAANPNFGAVGARQIAADGSTQQSIRGFPSLVGILGDLLRIRTGIFDSYRQANFDYEREQTAPQPMGTFIAFRRSALKEIGSDQQPFDKRFPIFFNEVDLLYRLNQAGWPALYAPSIRILHHGGEGTRQVRRAMIWESHKSLIRFLLKHKVRWWNFPLYALIFVAIYVGAYIRARGYSAGFRG